MRRHIVTLALSIFWVCVVPPNAEAIVHFKKGFEKLYITPDTDEEYAKLIKSNKTGCLVCHQGKTRKHHNPYGVHLVELLDKKKDAKDKEKIAAALKKVEKLHSDPEDDKSPTYGELIRANKLPGGPLEELQKEPEGAEDSEEESDEA